MLFGGGRAGAAALACGAARAAPRPAVAGMGALRAGRLQGVGAGVGGAGASVGGAGAGVTGLGRSNGVWQQQTRHRGTGSMVQGAQLGIRVRNGNVEQAFFRQNRIMREEGLVMRFKSELRHEKPAAKRYRMKNEARRRREKREVKKLMQEALKMRELGY